MVLLVLVVIVLIVGVLWYRKAREPDSPRPQIRPIVAYQPRQAPVSFCGRDDDEGFLDHV